MQFPLKVTITPELRAVLNEIDRLKANTISVTQLPKEEQEAWLLGYAEDAAYHGASLDAYVEERMA